ncbi:MAG: carbamoyl-phosphate synthase large subunit [Cardiobacteriaceae bacterium]|nr:carbamoyl-phosphate synthase large subunit [Cardiobacteriaceae bacterium]
MSKRTDIKSILIIGAGPIVIGQACEFDYSGAQACKALKREGYRIILVNSNPATIMTDPEMADATYIEPIKWQTVEKIIAKEKPDAILPTMGGQTALNCALDLARNGVLEKYGVELIGASVDAISTAEDRDLFKKAMSEIGLESAKSFAVHSMQEAREAQAKLGFPVIVRPSFTLGGSGGGIAYNKTEFEEIVAHGLDLSPTTEVLLEESLLGWKEFEMEVVRDKNDNAIIVCSIENFDPMGVHTGDSITVAPAQTLTDKEYQRMRNASIAILRKIGVETGGSNVQFAVNPKNGRLIVIEMNPRVSRSSALASKATGFPIASVAARLAVGYTLDELKNEITGGATPASFEPTIDYVVTKIPRFDFAKFKQSDNHLDTQMRAVGEVMAIGRTFKESLHKAIRSLEEGHLGFDRIGFDNREKSNSLSDYVSVPTPQRIFYVAEALRQGWTVEQVYEATSIDPWFLAQIAELIAMEYRIGSGIFSLENPEVLLEYKRAGFSDYSLGKLVGKTEAQIREMRWENGIRPVYKRVDSCAAEFASQTAYMYSTYEKFCEAMPTGNRKIMILGGGPNRIGQGIEFDYCCVHAALALKEDGIETIMVNCNPETVSTDFDTADRLYFEPLTLEDVLEIVNVEQPSGVIVQYGGQTPLKLARALEAAGVPIIGTSPDAIDRAEDRERFQQLIKDLGFLQPPNRTATDADSAITKAREIGYPLVVRPSYVLGGRAMEIVYNDQELRSYMKEAVNVSPEAPVLLDRFLDNAVEVDIDIVCDGNNVVVGGIMEHIEEAGVHSGDSACSLPPYRLAPEIVEEIAAQAAQMAQSLGVVGLMNAQFAVKGYDIYILEVNPRASRTVPFVSKATGRPLAKIAARCMTGKSLPSQGITAAVNPRRYAVKEAVFPFAKFHNVDPILGPEMKSTGEVMGIGDTFSEAFGKAVRATGENLPKAGCNVFLSVKDADKPMAVEICRILADSNCRITATDKTAQYLQEHGIKCELVNKVAQGRPHIVDHIINGDIDFIVNTTDSKRAIADSYDIRRNALMHKVFYCTTIAGGLAAAAAIAESDKEEIVRSLQEVHRNIRH